MSDPRPIGVFDSGVGGLTVLREILRRSPAESTIYLGDNARAPYGVRPDEEVLAFSTEALDALAERDVKAIVVACNTSTAVAIGALPAALRPADPRRHPARRVGRGAGHPQPAGRRHRHAGHDPLARLLQRDQGREPRGRGLRARDADARAAGRGRRADRADAEAAVAEALAPLLGERDAAGEFDLPAPARRDDRHAAARLHPLPAAARRSSRPRSATGSRSSTPRRRRRRRWPSCSGSTASRPGSGGGAPTHLQLTTGDAGTFRALAGRLFGVGVPRRRAGRARGRDPMIGRRPMTGRNDGRPVARRPRLAGRLPRRLGARRGGDGRRPARREGRAARPRRLARGRADRHRPPARCAGHADRGRAARRRACLRRGDGPDRAGPVDRAREPSCPASSSGPASSTGPAGSAPTPATFASLIGKLETDLLDQVMPPGGGLAKATMALANRWVTTRQLGFLLGFMGPRVLGQYDLALLSAEAAPGPAPVRRGEHPGRRPARSTCRSARSGPGSPSTRRPTPSSSRRIPGCGRTSPSGSSAS